MSTMHFDLYFDGTLAPDADPATVRQHLAVLFKLDAAGVARLFSGQSMLVKRAVDGATAAKFEQAFHQAGAVLLLTPIEAEPAPAANPRDIAAPEVLEVLPLEGFIEHYAVSTMPAPDTSYLSLVTETNWSLEDCQIPIPPAPAVEFSHLTLAALDPTSTRKNNEL
jgi:hypothetical protein